MYNNPSATAVKTETPRTFQSPTSESLLGKRPTIASPAPIPPAYSFIYYFLDMNIRIIIFIFFDLQ